MSHGQRPQSREVQAQAAADAAANGELPFVNDYKLQQERSQFRLTAPPIFIENTRFDKGSVAGAYVDFDRGLVIYDFQVGDEYDPNSTPVDQNGADPSPTPDR